MKTEEKLVTFETFETNAPELQYVTWGNRVATLLGIALVWGGAFICTGLAGQNMTLSDAYLMMLGVFGGYVFAFFSVLALFSKKKSKQFWARFFAWLGLPISIAAALFYEPNESNLSISKLLLQQFLISGMFFIAYLFLNRKEIK